MLKSNQSHKHRNLYIVFFTSLIMLLALSGCQKANQLSNAPQEKQLIDFINAFGALEPSLLDIKNNVGIDPQQVSNTCASINYRLSGQVGNYYVYLEVFKPSSHNLQDGTYTFRQRLPKSSNSNVLIMAIFRKNPNTEQLEDVARDLGSRGSSSALSASGYIRSSDEIWAGIVSQEPWNLPALQISGNCQTTTPTPVFSHVSPSPVPVNASRQWIEIHGSNFVNPVTVDLIHNNRRYRIPSDRYRFVNSSTIKVFAGITQGGEWGIDIYNPNGKSSSGKFQAQGASGGNGDLSTRLARILFKISDNVTPNSPGKLTFGYLNQYPRATQQVLGLSHHAGMDFRANSNHTVYSPISGKVVNNGNNSYGIVGVYNSERNITVFFVHLSNSFVNNGDTVNVGSRIGKAGSRGSPSPHLHLEVRNGYQSTALGGASCGGFCSYNQIQSKTQNPTILVP